MNNLILRAKHWQIFLLSFGLPLLLQIGLAIFIFISASTNIAPDQTFFGGIFFLFPFVMILLVAVLFSWFWAVVIGLQTKVPKEVKMAIGRFKVFFFLPLVYIVFILAFITISFNGLTEDGSTIASVLFLIIPLHMFSMFCILHTLYFAAKTFKTVELQRAVSFSDFAGEFFMIWFYPIGIWIVQPKINEMIKD